MQLHQQRQWHGNTQRGVLFRACRWSSLYYCRTYYYRVSPVYRGCHSVTSVIMEQDLLIPVLIVYLTVAINRMVKRVEKNRSYLNRVTLAKILLIDTVNRIRNESFVHCILIVATLWRKLLLFFCWMLLTSTINCNWSTYDV